MPNVERRVNVKGPDGNALAGGSVYLFVTPGNSADTSWVSALENKGAAAVIAGMEGAALNYTMGASVAAGNYSYATANGFTLKTNEEMGMSGNTSYTLYAVIFDSATITDESKFYTTAARSLQTLGDTATQNKLWTLTATTSGTSSNWKAVNDVPEPTSGLLLLVGASLLALRRKQK